MAVLLLLTKAYFKCCCFPGGFFCLARSAGVTSSVPQIMPGNHGDCMGWKIFEARRKVEHA